MSDHGPNTNEPFWWLLFSAGGVVAAMFVPAMMIATVMMGVRGWPSEPAGVASPAHYALTYFHFKALLAHPVAKLVVFVLFALPMFHAMHRVRHTLEETPLGAWKTLITGSCYLFAITCTLLCGIALIHIH